ncbi:MAG: hypothetical protein F6K23_38335 [Okeania sp. SIO2C9]|nr:hypothetical protein [Okeania sp. SIO2C9]NEQ78335.1 hypothetical protein [Okeania sp. SIO2C9]
MILINIRPRHSVPMLLEVAEFWCNYYFDCPLSEKFPQEFVEIKQGGK